MNALVSNSFEQCAEHAGDITELVYNKFFAQCGDALPLMELSDQHMKGRMLTQVIELLLTDQHLGEGSYLRWEVKNHLLAYGVELGMYQSFFNAVRDTVKDSLGSAWTTPLAGAWAEKIEALLCDIHSEASA
jgi:hypothetical protein